MGLIGIDHVQLAMPAHEEALARAFYVVCLGLTEVPKPEDLAKRGGAWFENNSVRVHLGVDRSFTPAKKAHPAFLVEELHAIVGRVREGGYQVVDDDDLEGFERVYVYDPFGNRIELMERLPG